MTLTGDWNYPTRVRFGAGRIADLPAACREAGMEIPLVVTDPGLVKLPYISEVTGVLKQAGMGADVFSDVRENPTEENVAAGVAAYKRSAHDGVVAFGGGSALDAAKAIALMVGQTQPLWAFEDLGDNWKRVNVAGMAPVVAVPTTAGTGSEVGRASVITDSVRHVKRLIFHPRMLPVQVIADPCLTLGLPPHLTAATGMDALSHNLEAFCAPSFHPMARGIAKEGIKLVKANLVNAVKDGTDVNARAGMLAASTMGATAFQRGLGAMHALAHPLGALHSAHHGLLNAILMPYVLRRNMEAINSDLAELALVLSLRGAPGQAVLDWVLALRAEIGIPRSLKDIGIDGGDADAVARMATEDAAAATNPVQLSEDDYRALYLAAVEGGV